MVAVLDWVCRDWHAFRERVLPAPPPTPGMFTYRFTPPGGQVRVHLRVQSDGQGVLFVDVTEVVHLNQTATEIAKWALDGIPRDLAETRLATRSQGSRKIDIQADLAAIYELVARLGHPDQGCPTCALDTINRRPLFSSPVGAPFKADLAITYQCNNDCPHCYNEVDRLTLQAMPVEDWKRVLDRLSQVGVPHLIFTGGEATLYPDLPELIAYADRLGPICGLNSNGRRFAHGAYANELAEAGLNHLQVTLGSHRADVHNRMMHADSFDQTVRGIQNARDAGIQTITNTTLMRMNANHIEDTIQFLHDLGIRTFAMNGMIYSGGGFETGQAIPEDVMPAMLVQIRDQARRLGMRFLWYTPTQYCRLSPVELEIGAKRCNAGEYSLCVEPNADVLPCQSYYVAAGNLLRDPWEQIWESSLFHSFRDRELDPRKYGLPEKCWECPDLPLCGGGCRIEREAAEGNRIREPATRGGCHSCGSGGCTAVCDCESDGQMLGFVDVEALSKMTVARGGQQHRRETRRGSGEFAPGQLNRIEARKQ